ncbi:MAG: GNAT family N-acetyltransferase [Acidimicrobiaceae bacterium]|nr:GNAT family N-acetyltransferase [Acidimicrobiaceae bacterium]
MIRELATYEHATLEAKADDAALSAALFGEHPHVFCHVGELDGRIEAMALWFLSFSTWLGNSGLYLEDLYVREPVRGHGLGGALMRELARICVEQGYSRFEWSVLDWNAPTIAFYRSIGAVSMDEWTRFRLSEDALVTFASS